mmetsp:Transcript_11180/g.26105  ORF Transcript_11180/g.26105 Transcript_11180/m.26105 type:complete len:125 (-) Transcript_11180:80-454(-)
MCTPAHANNIQQDSAASTLMNVLFSTPCTGQGYVLFQRAPPADGCLGRSRSKEDRETQSRTSTQGLADVWHSATPHTVNTDNNQNTERRVRSVSAQNVNHGGGFGVWRVWSLSICIRSCYQESI